MPSSSCSMTFERSHHGRNSGYRATSVTNAYISSALYQIRTDLWTVFIEWARACATDCIEAMQTQIKHHGHQEKSRPLQPHRRQQEGRVQLLLRGTLRGRHGAGGLGSEVAARR